MSRGLRIVAISSLIVGVCSGATYATYHYYIPSGRVVPGVRVHGIEVPDAIAQSNDSQMVQWLRERASAMSDRTIEIRVDATSRSVPLSSFLEPILDTQLYELAFRLRAIGHEGSWLKRFQDAKQARAGLKQIEFTWSVNTASLEKFLLETKNEIDAPAIDAKLDLSSHRIQPDSSGRSLDVTRASEQISSAIQSCIDQRECPNIITIESTKIPARVTKESLSRFDISTVLSSFTTSFSRAGDQASRAINIEVAAQKLNGLTLEPNAVVSFNQVVGERVETNGFKMAWEIFKGEMRPGIGGGTCQVASTLHAAALFGGLDILERLPHSRPSAYIKMGLDSTVVYPIVDLKIRNTFSFPVVVHTQVSKNNLTIELLGARKPVDVVFASDVVEKFPYQRRVDEEPGVSEGKQIKKQGGIYGYRVRRVRTVKATQGFAFPDGQPQRVEVQYDYYPPTTEIYRVAPGTDPNDLPSLPEDVLQALARKNAKNENANLDAVACVGACASEPEPSRSQPQPKSKTTVLVKQTPHP